MKARNKQKAFEQELFAVGKAALERGWPDEIEAASGAMRRAAEYVRQHPFRDDTGSMLDSLDGPFVEVHPNLMARVAEILGED
jgi:hypothetical protein